MNDLNKYNMKNRRTSENTLKIGIWKQARWPNSANFPVTNGMVYYSGNQYAYHRHGLAIFVPKIMKQSVFNFTPVSDRILLLQIQRKTCKLNIIQIYVATQDNLVEEVWQFYKEVN